MRCITNRRIGLFCFNKQNSDTSIIVYSQYFYSEIQRVTFSFIQDWWVMGQFVENSQWIKKVRTIILVKKKKNFFLFVKLSIYLKFIGVYV